VDDPRRSERPRRPHRATELARRGAPQSLQEPLGSVHYTSSHQDSAHSLQEQSKLLKIGEERGLGKRREGGGEDDQKPAELWRTAMGRCGESEGREGRWPASDGVWRCGGLSDQGRDQQLKSAFAASRRLLLGINLFSVRPIHEFEMR
jgi:hypothetical protein